MNQDEKRIYHLGIILKNIDYFNMNKFDDRLILQKTIYILKSFGIDLGYEYNWYRYGVYSPDLTSDGFDLMDIYQEIPKINMEYKSKETQLQFNSFLKFMNDKKSNADVLELSSSICYWVRIKTTKKETVDMVNVVKSYFDVSDCEHMWDELYKYNIVGRV